MSKAKRAAEVKKFTDIPNIGPATVKDFAVLGIRSPQELSRANAYDLYETLCKKTRMRHDPCVLDTFMAAVDFMSGAPARPWYAYTAKRKKQYPNI